MTEDSSRRYWRRRDESRRRAQDDARRSHRYFTDRLRESQVAALRHAGEAERLDREIAGREYEAHLQGLRNEMQRLRTAVLDEMASDPLTQRWHQQLSGIDLVKPDADAELTALFEEVERKKALWSYRFTELPQLTPSLPAMGPRGDALGRSSRLSATRRSVFALDAIELEREQTEREREAARLREEQRLDRIASALVSLIARKKEHDLAHRQGA